MLTASEISAGSGRLDANKLTVSDRETLLSMIRLYLKNRIAGFPDIASRLAAVADSNDVKTASKLAAVLIQIEDGGFAVAELAGGRSGLKFSETDELTLRIRFALVLLGYDLPEEFSGSTNTGGENVETNIFYPSVSLDKKATW